MRTARSIFIFISLALLAACSVSSPQPSQPTFGPSTGLPATPTSKPPTPLAPPSTPTTEETPISTAEPPLHPWQVAYVGPDGNVYLLDPATGQGMQVTRDAVRAGPNQQGTTITYYNLKWSTDGSYLAFQRETGTPTASQMLLHYDLSVYAPSSGELRPVISNIAVSGYDWKPDSHLIAYGLPVAPDYFTRRGEVHPDRVTGIWAVDADNPEPYELVPAQGGYSIVNPDWSPDGRRIGVEEVYLIEGRGRFAYYDLEARRYVAWEEPIGNYSWSPDASLIAYDRLTYAPTLTERIFLRRLEGGQEELLSPEFSQGYAFSPQFSPQGDRLAYLAERLLEGGASRYEVYVQSLGGEAVLVSEVEQPGNLIWSPDGSRLLLRVGPYEQFRLVEISLADNSIRELVMGSDADWLGTP